MHFSLLYIGVTRKLGKGLTASNVTRCLGVVLLKHVKCKQTFRVCGSFRQTSKQKQQKITLFYCLVHTIFHGIRFSHVLNSNLIKNTIKQIRPWTQMLSNFFKLIKGHSQDSHKNSLPPAATLFKAITIFTIHWHFK